MGLLKTFVKLGGKPGVILKHAAPIHPGTGTDQSVHGSGGGGAFAPKWEFTEVYEDDPTQFFAPGLDAPDVGAKEAYAEVNRLSTHIDDLFAYAETEAAKNYNQRVEDYLTDDYARFDRETALKLMDKHGRLDSFRRESLSRWIRTQEGKRWRLEVVRAQNRAKTFAEIALPELLERGRLLHDDVVGSIDISEIGDEFNSNKYYGGYSMEQKNLIAEQHPEEFGAMHQKIKDLHTKYNETETLVHEIKFPKHTDFRPGEMQPPSWEGGKPWKKATGEAYFAIPADEIKQLKDGEFAFKNWRRAAETQEIHTEVRTMDWPEGSYLDRLKAERPFVEQFEADMGPDFVILDATSYSQLWGQASQSGRASAKRYSNQISNAVDAFDKKAEAFFKTTRRDLLIAELESRGIPIGGDIETTHGRRTRGTETMDTASRFIPTAWIDRSNSKGPVTLEFLRNSRAHYNPNEAKLRVDGSLPTTLHEFGHRMQHIDPTIRAFEDAFYDYRTEGEELVPLNTIKGHEHYASNETSRPDKWFTPYTGKVYRYGYYLVSNDGHVSSNNMGELLSTGYPTFVMTNVSQIPAGHEEEAYFMWGLLDATGR